MDEKGSRVKPEKPNGYKFETLVLDMVHMMNDSYSLRGREGKGICADQKPGRRRFNRYGKRTFTGEWCFVISKKRHLLFL